MTSPRPATEVPTSPSSAAGRPSPIHASDRSGALAFARFAFRPNALGYCGGQAPGELFDRVLAGADDPDLRRLCGEFAGARPYLELLALAPGARGPLDPHVVEAYWVGGPLLEALDPHVFQADLERHVRPRATADDWRWLAGCGTSGGCGGM